MAVEDEDKDPTMKTLSAGYTAIWRDIDTMASSQNVEL